MAQTAKKATHTGGAEKNTKKERSRFADGASLRKNNILLYALLLGIIAFCVYANTLKNGFVLDDGNAITKNALVTKGIAGIPEILLTPYHHGSFRAKDNGPDVDDLYRPLSLVMFAAEYQLSENNPAVGHFVNVLIFALTVSLLFLFLHSLFLGKRPVTAFVAALLFAVHPIHTEIVANIKSRDELLCFFFVFCALFAIIKYIDTRRVLLLIAGLFFYFLSLLSKETSVTMLAVIPMVLFFHRPAFRKQSLIICLSCVGMVAVYLLIRYSILREYRAHSSNAIAFIENALVQAPSYASRLATEFLILGNYVKLLFVPYPLSCDYAFKAIPFSDFSEPGVWLSILLYMALIVAGVVRIVKQKNDPLALGIFFFLITISLFSNIFILIASEMAERFLFFPSAGFCLVIAFVFGKYLLKGEEKISAILKDRMALLVLSAIIVIFGSLTVERNTDWKDDFTLFVKDSRKLPDDSRLAFFAGSQEMFVVNSSDADPATRREMLADGIRDFQHSVAVYPEYAPAHEALADAFLVAGQMDSAEEHGKTAVKIAPTNSNMLNGLGNVYLAKKRYPEATDLFKRAAANSMSNPNFLGSVGVCYLFTRNFDTAISYFRRSISIDPANSRQIKYIAVAFYAVGQIDSARKYEAIVRQSEPGFSVDKIPLPN